MQKKLIALAIAGLSGAAFAQSNVTISGTIQGGYAQYKIGSLNQTIRTATATSNAQNKIDDQSSKIVLSGKEDLGNGLSALFQIDNRFASDTAGVSATGTGSLASGNSFFGLSGNWGTAVIGRNDVHYHTSAEFGLEGYTAGPLQALASFGLMNQVGGSAVSGRLNNAFQYDSPNMNGFKGRIAVVTNGAAAEGSGVGNSTAGAVAGQASNPGDGYGYNLLANYSNGPMSLLFSYFNNKIEGRSSNNAQPVDTNSTRLGGAYTFPMGLKVGLLWDRSTLKNVTSITNALTAGTLATTLTVTGAGIGAAASDLTRTGWSLPISYKTGNHAMYFTYTKLGNLSGTTGANTGAKQTTLGYGYTLSKRTSVGAYWTKLSNDDSTSATISNTAGNARSAYSLFANGGSAPAAGETQTAINIGLQHNF